MPVYEYECKECGHVMEVFQKITDPPLTNCERCNGQVKKLISQSTFHLKGTGWYVTDYASKDRNASSGTKGASETKSGSSGKEVKASSKGSEGQSTAKKET